MGTPDDWMDQFRKQPFYMNDFLYTEGGQFSPWFGVGVGGGAVANAGSSGSQNVGAITLKSHASNANSGYRAQTILGVHFLNGSEIFEAVIMPRNMAGTVTRLGFHDTDTDGDAVDGAYFEIGTDSLVIGKTAANNVRSTTSTSYKIGAVDVYYRVKLILNADATRVDYYLYAMDGTQLWTDNLTTNITKTRATGHGIISTMASPSSATNLIDLDYMAVYLGTLIR